MTPKTHHAKMWGPLVSQNCPDLKFTKLATPLSVSVASAESKFQAVGMMQIPIVLDNGGGGGGGGQGRHHLYPFLSTNNFCLYPSLFYCYPRPIHHPVPSIKILVVDKLCLDVVLYKLLQLLKVKRH